MYQNLPNVLRTKWGTWGTLVLLACSSLATSRTRLQWLLTCLNFTLDSKDLFFRYKQKKWILWNMAAIQAAKSHGYEWGLTWYIWCGIYTSILAWIHSQNSLATAEALNSKIWNLYCYRTSLKWPWTLAQSAWELSQAMWWNEASCFEFD